MTAEIKIWPQAELSLLAIDLGVDPNECWSDGYKFFVPGVTQEALDGAKRNYNQRAVDIVRLRVERTRRLFECDWTVLADSKVRNLMEWITYRQALRDMPRTVDDPQNPKWPEPPAGR